MKCDVEVGESTATKKKLGLQRWWWAIHPTTIGCSLTGDNGLYKSRQAAVRNAKVWARRFGLSVTSVVTHGKDPANED